jgi:hypothetical protein
MPRMPRLLKKILEVLLIGGGTMGGFVGFLVFLSIGSLFIDGRDVAPGVTTAGIETIRPGMSSAQVVALLGRPYYIDSYKGSGTHDVDGNCRTNDGLYRAAVDDTLDIAGFLERATADSAVHSCDIGDFRAHDRNTTFTYSRPPAWAGRYPMLWVHFDSTAQVREVFAKQYTSCFFLEDDAVIYSMNTTSLKSSARPKVMSDLFDK